MASIPSQQSEGIFAAPYMLLWVAVLGGEQNLVRAFQEDVGLGTGVLNIDEIEFPEFLVTFFSKTYQS